MPSKATDSESYAGHDILRREFDALAHALLGISGIEFEHRWNNGEFSDDTNPDVMSVALMMPTTR